MTAAWVRAVRAAEMLRVAPGDLGGLWIRARSSPARDALLDLLAPLGAARLHPDISDEALSGGPDLAATLATGRLHRREGLVARAPALLLAMAERAGTGLAGRLGLSLDAGGPPVIALDEGAGEEAPPAALTERLGLFVPLDGLALGDLVPPPEADIAAARLLYPRIAVPHEIAGKLVSAAAACGIASLRAPRFALAATRANAALEGRSTVTDDDAALAAALCLAHRGAPPETTEAPEDAPDGTPPPEPRTDPDDGGAPEDRLVEAVRTALPPGLLAALTAAGRARQTGGAGAGAKSRSSRRGRPLPARPGRPESGPIDASATLRAAVPWQTIRRRTAPDDPRRLLVRPADIRLKRFERHSDRLVIFVVDASGSAAMARMAEAKGAIESLLTDSYAARDEVALVAFRREEAELLLPPTRSLVQSRRRLAALPGGGGTPLAAGLAAAESLARRAADRGYSPSLVLLTDGRANIALDGSASRARAAADAEAVARRLAAPGLPALVIDTGTRPNPALGTLAAHLGATLLSLPRQGAGEIARTLAP